MDLERIWDEVEHFQLEDGTKLGSLFKSGNDKIRFCYLVIRLGEYEAAHYERFTRHIARAFEQFGNVPDQKDPVNLLPTNAVTLWRHMVNGFNRVADRPTASPEK